MNKQRGDNLISRKTLKQSSVISLTFSVTLCRTLFELCNLWPDNHQRSLTTLELKGVILSIFQRERHESAIGLSNQQQVTIVSFTQPLRHIQRTTRVYKRELSLLRPSTYIIFYFKCFKILRMIYNLYLDTIILYSSISFINIIFTLLFLHFEISLAL